MKPIILKSNYRLDGASYVGDHQFADGSIVPIYELSSMHSFNQLLGHAKFNNHKYGQVLYRGECSLHDNLLPSLFRDQNCKVAYRVNQLKTLINRFVKDVKASHFIKVENDESKWVVEGMLQHYGASTRFIDLVDNHWIALWMGLNKCAEITKNKGYYRYFKRDLGSVQIVSPDGYVCINKDELYQYVLLVAVPTCQMQQTGTGIFRNNDMIYVDLRRSLPSTFLRPHAQHGCVLQRNVEENDYSRDNFNLASQVVGILRVRIDLANQWLGNGELLTQENLFPNIAYDTGYNMLLQRGDLFKDSMHKVTLYV